MNLVHSSPQCFQIVVRCFIGFCVVLGRLGNPRAEAASLAACLGSLSDLEVLQPYARTGTRL